VNCPRPLPVPVALLAASPPRRPQRDPRPPPPGVVPPLSPPSPRHRPPTPDLYPSSTSLLLDPPPSQIGDFAFDIHAEGAALGLGDRPLAPLVLTVLRENGLLADNPPLYEMSSVYVGGEGDVRGGVSGASTSGRVAAAEAAAANPGSMAGRGLSRPHVERYLEALEATYLDNPYHNSRHAADVVQAVHCMLVRDFAPSASQGSALDRLDRLCLVLAAAAHDAGHPGLTNDFHVRSQDAFSAWFNDTSCNEMYHAWTAFELLRLSPKHDILHGLSPEDRASVRRVVIQTILATDMSQHFLLLQVFERQLDTEGPKMATWDPVARLMILKVCLHLADLSNPARPIALARKWGLAVAQEMYAQGDVERAHGMRVSPVCDRHTAEVTGGQIRFIRYFLRPTVDLFLRVAPRFGAELAAGIDATMVYWTRANEEVLRAQEERDAAARRALGEPGQASGGGPTKGGGACAGPPAGGEAGRAKGAVAVAAAAADDPPKPPQPSEEDKRRAEEERKSKDAFAAWFSDDKATSATVAARAAPVVQAASAAPPLSPGDARVEPPAPGAVAETDATGGPSSLAQRSPPPPPDPAVLEARRAAARRVRHDEEVGASDGVPDGVPRTTQPSVAIQGDNPSGGMVTVGSEDVLRFRAGEDAASRSQKSLPETTESPELGPRSGGPGRAPTAGAAPGAPAGAPAGASVPFPGTAGPTNPLTQAVTAAHGKGRASRRPSASAGDAGVLEDLEPCPSGHRASDNGGALLFGAGSGEDAGPADRSGGSEGGGRHADGATVSETQPTHNPNERCLGADDERSTESGVSPGPAQAPPLPPGPGKGEGSGRSRSDVRGGRSVPSPPTRGTAG